jgi:hypothetical protein
MAISSRNGKRPFFAVKGPFGDFAKRALFGDWCRKLVHLANLALSEFTVFRYTVAVISARSDLPTSTIVKERFNVYGHLDSPN